MWSLGKGAGCRVQGEGEGVGCRDYGVEFGVEVMGEGGGGTNPGLIYYRKSQVVSDLLTTAP